MRVAVGRWEGAGLFKVGRRQGGEMRWVLWRAGNGVSEKL